MLLLLFSRRVRLCGRDSCYCLCGICGGYANPSQKIANRACRVKKPVLIARLTRWNRPVSSRQSGRSSGVEHNLAKVGVEGSNPFARSKYSLWTIVLLFLGTFGILKGEKIG